VRVGGSAILYKTLAGLSDEVAAAEPARVALGGAAPIVTPVGGDEGRCLIRYAKQARSPASLPRRSGLPEHRPLTRADLARITAEQAAAHERRAQERRRPKQRRR
jgi:hypothetical protein